MHRLQSLVEQTEARIHKHSWSRIFRDPDFSKENSLTRAEIDRLKSRVSLFLSVAQLFPAQIRSDSPIFNKTLSEDLDDSDEEENSNSSIHNSRSSTYSTENSTDNSNGSSSKDLTDSLELPPDVQDGLGPLESSFWQNLIARAAL